MDYFAYADFEFTCSEKIKEFKDKKHINETMSVGIVITQNGKVVDTFYETIKPVYNTELTSFCKELTHLTQEEIDNSRNFTDVMYDASNFFDKYNGSQLIVYGNQDRENLRREIHWHKKEMDKYTLKRLNIFVNKISNKQTQICQQILKESVIISLNDCKKLLDIPGEIKHNALDDAIDLAMVDYMSKRKMVPAKVRKKYLQQRKDEIRYKQLRRVKDEHIVSENEEDEKMRIEIRNVANYLKEKNSNEQIMESTKMNAIVDDLLNLVREGD